MSHAGRWLNIARRVLAHVRAYLDSGQYGECRDNEQAMLASLSAWRIESNRRSAILLGKNSHFCDFMPNRMAILVGKSLKNEAFGHSNHKNVHFYSQVQICV